MSDLPIFLTLPEVAELLRSSPTTIRKMKNGPPRKKVPGLRRYLYPSRDLMAWINSVGEGKDTTKQPRAVDTKKAKSYHRNPMYRLDDQK